MPAQLLRSRAEGSYWALHAGTLPPFGLSVFDVVVEGEERGVARPRAAAAGATLENAH